MRTRGTRRTEAHEVVPGDPAVIKDEMAESNDGESTVLRGLSGLFSRT
ncbi:hypothetical protein GCM10022221_10600 [Actinocorallia aurea]